MDSDNTVDIAFWRMLQAIAERERQEQAIAQLREALQQLSRLPPPSHAPTTRLNTTSMTAGEVAEQLDVVSAQGLVYREDLERERQDRLNAERRLSELLSERQALILQVGWHTVRELVYLDMRMMLLG